MRVLRPPFGSECFPKQRAVRTPVRKDGETPAAVICGREENAIVPHDGRRVAPPRHRLLPNDVLRRRPRIRISATADEPLSGRSTPTRPVRRRLTLGPDHLNSGILTR